MRRNVEKNINDKLVIKSKNRIFSPEIIFIDLDGTLLDKFNKKPSKKNIEALKKTTTYTNVVISTGRSFSKKVKKIMKMLNVEYAICQNGAIVATKDEKIILNITLNKNQIDEIIKLIKNENKKLFFTKNSEFKIYTDYWLWAPLRFFFKNKWIKISKFESKNNEVNKIVIGGFLSKNKTWELANKISKTIKDISVKTSGKDKIIEITKSNATKGNGAVFVSKILGANVKNTIHIGDSENDSTTFDKVGALIAMENSSTKLLNLATHLGPKHRKNGIAKILLNGLIKEKK